MTLEEIIEAWLEEVVAAEPADKPLHQAQVCDSAFGRIEKDRVVMIGPAEGDLAPEGTDLAGEFGGVLILVILVRVADREPASYKAARDRAVSMGRRLAQLAFDDSQLGGRVRDSLPGTLKRSFTPGDGQKYAVANLPLHINVAGQQIGG